MPCKLLSKMLLFRINVILDNGRLMFLLGYSVASVRTLVDAHTLDVDIVVLVGIDLWALLNWWELDIPMCANILECYVWLDSLHVTNRACLFLEGVGGSFVVHMELS
ncbi:hypothetical protein Tco_0441938 [Tanacetum coccineum]